MTDTRDDDRFTIDENPPDRRAALRALWARTPAPVLFAIIYALGIYMMIDQEQKIQHLRLVIEQQRLAIDHLLNGNGKDKDKDKGWIWRIHPDRPDRPNEPPRKGNVP